MSASVVLGVAMLLVNFVGEAGAGKTTATAGLFYGLKTSGFTVEMVTEYSKELWIAGDTKTLSDELLVFSEKYRRIARMRNVDIVLSDSPLINSVVYGGDQFGAEAKAFYARVAEEFDNIYIIIDRQVDYVTFGRNPDETSAKACGSAIVALIERGGCPRIRVPGLASSGPAIARFVVEQAALRGIVVPDVKSNGATDGAMIAAPAAPVSVSLGGM